MGDGRVDERDDHVDGRQSRSELAEGTRRVLMFASCSHLQLLADRVGASRRAGARTARPGLDSGGDHAAAACGGCTCGAGAKSDVMDPDREGGLEVIRVPTRKWPPWPLPKSLGRLVSSSGRRPTTGRPKLGRRRRSTPTEPTSTSSGRRRHPSRAYGSVASSSGGLGSHGWRNCATAYGGAQ